MEIKLRHEKTPELTGIDIGIDETDIKMLKAGISVGQRADELDADIEIKIRKDQGPGEPKND